MQTPPQQNPPGKRERETEKEKKKGSPTATTHQILPSPRLLACLTRATHENTTSRWAGSSAPNPLVMASLQTRYQNLNHLFENISSLNTPKVPPIPPPHRLFNPQPPPQRNQPHSRCRHKANPPTVTAIPTCGSPTSQMREKVQSPNKRS